MKVLSFLLLFKDNETIAYMDPKVIVSAYFFHYPDEIPEVVTSQNKKDCFIPFLRC